MSKYIYLSPELNISRIINGLWQVADMERDGKSLDLDQAAKALVPYVEAGLTTFDMADHYGSSELIAGILLKKYVPKDSIQLLTKWVPAPGKLTKNDVKEAVVLSLKRMQVDCLDLLQYHAWNYADPCWLDHLYWLQELSSEGLIKNIGLTNFDTAHLKMTLDSGIKVVSNQVSFSLLDQRAKTTLLALCESYGIKVLAYGTMAGGFLSEQWITKDEPDANKLDTWSLMKYKRFIDQAGGWSLFQNTLNDLTIFSNQSNNKITTLASKYILDQPGVGAVIIGVRPGLNNHLQSNLQLFDISLSLTEKEKIESSIHKFKPIPGDCGDEYRKPPYLTASGDLSHHLESLPPPYQTKMGSDQRIQALSGTMWEDIAGFSRAVKKGNRILISGTTATHGSKVIGGDDPASQANFILDKMEGALQSLGSSMQDVVRTRIYIRNISDWEVVARAHGARFKDIQPANTMVRADLIGDEYLVEMEAEAMLNGK